MPPRTPHCVPARKPAAGYSAFTLGLLASVAVALWAVPSPRPADSRPAVGGKPDRITKPAVTLLHDVYLREDAERLTFGSANLALQFDLARGTWLAARVEGVPDSLVSPPAHSIDATVDGRGLSESHTFRLVGYATTIAKDARSVSLAVQFELCPKGEGAGGDGPCEYELTRRYTVRPGETSFERSASLFRRPADGATEPPARKLQGFSFELPGVMVGSTTDCTVSVPGPFWPGRWVPSGTPYDELKSASMAFHSAPDAGFGLLAVSNPAANLTVASWMVTGGETAYQSALRGDGTRLTFRHRDGRAYRLLPGMSAESDVHHVEIVRGPLPAALAQYRRMVEQTMPPLHDPPAWAREAVILEAYPKHYPGGLKGLTERLPFYRDVGFNTVYLMPHWKGGYSPIDLFAVDPSLGTKDELRKMVRQAHELGMRVLFDMVIHGFNEKSPVVREHPELFVRDEGGGLARHPAWKSVTTDWASPAYQQYMADLVWHDLREYDIDGYRVDAATFKGPGWDPALPYPAYRPGSAAPELVGRMRAALREKKPGAVLLSEVFGPLFYTTCGLVHDNQTEAPQFFLEQMEAGKTSAARYKAHMADVLDALPAGANRVYFARNHDTSWFYHFNGYAPRFLALDAVHALFAVPEVFGGDPRHVPSPDDDPKVWDSYRKLYALRKRFPELARGEVLLREAECDQPQVFAGLRRLDGKAVLAVVSFSDREERAAVKLTLAGVDAAAGRVTLVDAMTGEEVDAPASGGAGAERVVSLTVKPFQVLVGRL